MDVVRGVLRRTFDYDEPSPSSEGSEPSARFLPVFISHSSKVFARGGKLASCTGTSVAVSRPAFSLSEINNLAARRSPANAIESNFSNSASFAVMRTSSPPFFTITVLLRVDSRISASDFSVFLGRPSGFPLWPGLNWPWRGGRLYPTSSFGIWAGCFLLEVRLVM